MPDPKTAAERVTSDVIAAGAAHPYPGPDYPGYPEDEDEISWCPQHGDQPVTGHSTSCGPDPYDITHLACGHQTIWFSADRADCAIL